MRKLTLFSHGLGQIGTRGGRLCSSEVEVVEDAGFLSILTFGIWNCFPKIFFIFNTSNIGSWAIRFFSGSTRTIKVNFWPTSAEISGGVSLFLYVVSYFFADLPISCIAQSWNSMNRSCHVVSLAIRQTLYL